MTESKVTFQRETIDQVKEEFMPLVLEHANEVEKNLDVIPPNPSWEMYYNMEKLGILGIYTARFKEELVGYFVVIASENLHSKEHVLASCDLIYVKPEHRNKNIGIKMIKHVEEDLIKLGVSSLHINSKVGKASFSPILERLNYEAAEVVYNKTFIKPEEN